MEENLLDSLEFLEVGIPLTGPRGVESAYTLGKWKESHVDSYPLGQRRLTHPFSRLTAPHTILPNPPYPINNPSNYRATVHAPFPTTHSNPTNYVSVLFYYMYQ